MILFVFILFLSGVAAEYKSTLTFVIDSTASMSNDINQVKVESKQIFDVVYGSKRSQIENFVLVTFNDPDPPKLLAVTKDESEFKAALDSISVNGGGDCDELSMTGIELGIKSSLPGSYLYVFTDASAKDHARTEYVKKLAQDKQAQIVFVLTSDCGSRTTPDYMSYHIIADATGGQVFHIEDRGVRKVLQYVKDSVTSRKTTIVGKKLPPGLHKVPFDVDHHMGDVTISISGNKEVGVKNITAPDGSAAPTEVVFNASTAEVVKILNPTDGVYTPQVDSRDGAKMLVTAETKVDFRYGFSLTKTRNFDNTNSRPFADTVSHVLISFLGNPDVVLREVQFFTMENEIIDKIPVKLIDKTHNIYITSTIKPPIGLFKIGIIFYDIVAKRHFRRTASIPVEAIKIADKKETIRSIPPKVIIDKGSPIKGYHNKLLDITCQVNAYPTPKVTWVNTDKEFIMPAKIRTQEPYTTFSTISITPSSKHNYRCIAENNVGTDSKDVSVDTAEPPLIRDKNTTIIFGLEHSDIEIKCKLSHGYPKPQIYWYRNREILREKSEILSIKNITIEDSAKYKCIALNGLGRDIHSTLLVVEKPATVVNAPSEVKVVRDSVARLTCDVAGVPRPTVTWEKNGEPFRHEDSIRLDTTLSFRATVNDSGTYTCTAVNKHGIDKAFVELRVYVPVQIESPSPGYIEVEAGGHVELECLASGLPTPTITWVFRPLDDPNQRIDVTRFKTPTTGALFTNNMKHIESGHYTCVADNGLSTSNITYLVKVNQAPIMKTTKDVYNAVVGDLALEIPCKAEGNPKPEVIWETDGFRIINDPNWFYISDDGTLTIVKVNKDSAGEYVCNIINKFGSLRKVFQVNVEMSPVSSPVVETKNVKEGGSVIIPCPIAHKSVDYIRWYRDGNILEDSQLVINDVQQDDAGNYTCRVSTNKESKSATVELIVKVPAKFANDAKTDILVKTPDEAIDLDCSVEGNTTPNVYWYHNRTLLSSVKSSTYNTWMQGNPYGNYICIVDDGEGHLLSRNFEVHPVLYR